MRSYKHKLLSLLCCMLLLLQVVGCTDGAQPNGASEETTDLVTDGETGTDGETNTDTETETETNTDTESDPVPTGEITLQAKTLVVEDGKVKLTLNCELTGAEDRKSVV